MNKLKIIILLASMLALTACQTTRPVVQPTPTLDGDPAIKAIKESAKSINESLIVLKEKEHARDARPVAPEPNDPKLLTEITMRAWNGPADKALEYIGLLTGYRVTTQGNKPALIPLVSINTVQTPAHKVLQDIGIQIGDKAGISVREVNREITLIYTK